MGIPTIIQNAINKANSVKSSANPFGGTLNSLNEHLSQDNKGDFYGMLGSILSKTLQDGMPNMDEYKQYSEGAINTSFKKSKMNLQENLSSNGMGNSGAALAALAQLSGEQASALGQNALGLGEMEQNFKNNTIGQLLQLNATGANATQNKINALFSLLGMQQNQMNFNREMDFREANQPSDFGQLLGTILGGAAQIGTASLLRG